MCMCVQRIVIFSSPSAVHQVCAGAGPECLSKASTCGEKMKPNAEYKQQFHEAYLLCEAKSDESKDESPESSGGSQRPPQRPRTGLCKGVIEIHDSTGALFITDLLVFLLQKILLMTSSANTRSVSWKKQDS